MLKAFIAEAGSGAMSSLVADTENRYKVASSLIVVELRSAIRRRQLLGDISKTDADFAVLSATEELERIILLPLTDKILSLATGVVERQRLRALDAIQLATAIDAKISLAVGMNFSSSYRTRSFFSLP